MDGSEPVTGHYPYLWCNCAIISTSEGKQFLRELSRLQMAHSSAEVRNTTNHTIALIDEYIK